MGPRMIIFHDSYIQLKIFEISKLVVSALVLLRNPAHIAQSGTDISFLNNRNRTLFLGAWRMERLTHINVQSTSELNNIVQVNRNTGNEIKESLMHVAAHFNFAISQVIIISQDATVQQL